jgi:hypothetical protein
LNRWVAYPREPLTFAYVKEVPFTNNLAEQATRGDYNQTKSSHAFRNATRSKSFGSLTSRDEDERYRKTNRKQGMNLLHTLLDINYNKQAPLKYT